MMKRYKLILLLAAFTTIAACTSVSKEKRMLTKYEWQRISFNRYHNGIPGERYDIEETMLMKLDKDDTGYFKDDGGTYQIDYSLNESELIILYDDMTLTYEIILLNDNKLIMNEKHADNLYDQQVYKKVE